MNRVIRSARRGAKEQLKRLLRAQGYDISSFAGSFNGSLIAAFREVGSAGVLLDVGANEGQYASLARSLGFRGRIVSFEPGTVAHEALQRRMRSDASWMGRRVALGSAPGEVDLNISANLVSSSTLAVLPTHVSAATASRTVSSERVPVTTLSAELASVALDVPLFCKIDVQGAEGDVLLGLGADVARCNWVQCELSFAELYQGQTSASQLLASMEAAGFEVYDFAPGFRSGTGRLLQADMLWTRSHE